MPFLSAMAAFRDSVRKEAIAIKATNILSECDKLRDDTLPELGVRLEDKVTRRQWFIFAKSSYISFS